MSRILRIDRCQQCPHLKLGELESTDGWDRGRDWTCDLTKKIIAGFVERPSDEPRKIPSWCPLERVRAPKKPKAPSV